MPISLCIINKYIYFLIFCLVFNLGLKAQVTLSENTKTALANAESNKVELENVIKYFSKKRSDSLKLKASIFLIDNMGFHQKINRDIVTDPKFLNLIKNNIFSIIP